MSNVQNTETAVRRLRIFLCYSSIDKEKSREIHNRLAALGYDVWRDEEKLVAGQPWHLEIERAIEEADIVIVCLSQASTSREGYIQREIKYARDVAMMKPEGIIYLIPARLEECLVPNSLSNYQWVDLSDDHGWNLLLKSIRTREKQLSGIVVDTTGLSEFDHKVSDNKPEAATTKSWSGNSKADEGGGFMWKFRQFFWATNTTAELIKSVREIAKGILSQNPGDVEKIAASQINLLTNYYLLVLGQAQRSFTWALIWAAVGVLGFIMAGVFLLINRISDIAVVGTIGSALIEVISGINFYLYGKASAQLTEFHTRLDATQKLLLSNAVAEKIEGDLKQITRSYIALKFAGIEVRPEDVEKSFDLTPKVRIIHIQLNPAGSDLAKEFVTIENSGKVVADMTNWSLSDEAGHRFRFPMFFLKPGTSVNVWTRNGKNIPTDLYWKMKRAIWNNNEDIAYLKDGNGSLIDCYKYNHSARQ